MTVSLRFADGMIQIDAESPDQRPPLPGVETDPRTGIQSAPAYRYAAIRAILAQLDIPVDDAIHVDQTLQLTTAYKLRPYQEDALAAWSDRSQRGVIELPTGSGKTVIAISAIASLGVPTLVVVPTIDLLEQWETELTREFGDMVEIGRLGGGEQQLGEITVSTYDSAYLRIAEIGNKFGLLVCDEVHHLGGQGYQDIGRLCAAPARLGLTATFERPDGAHEEIRELIGAQVYSIDVDSLAGEHLAAYDIRRIEVELTPQERANYEDAQQTFLNYVRSAGIQFTSGSDYLQLVKRSGNDPRAREALLAKQRAREIMMNAEEKATELGRILDRHRDDRVIVFTAHTELVYRLSERFLLPAITSETGTTERRQILSKFRDGTYSRVVAANVLDEGVDVPDANVAVVISGSGSEREFTQRLGRILRPKQDGSKAVLYELVSNETAEERVADRRR